MFGRHNRPARPSQPASVPARCTHGRQAKCFDDGLVGLNDLGSLEATVDLVNPLTSDIKSQSLVDLCDE